MSMSTVQAVYDMVVCDNEVLLRAYTPGVLQFVKELTFGTDFRQRHPQAPLAYERALKNGKNHAAFLWTPGLVCVVSITVSRTFFQFEPFDPCNIGEDLFVKSLEFRAAKTLQEYIDVFLRLIRLAIDFERVTFYPFDGRHDFAGQVTQESRKKGALSLWGVQRPQGDVPGFALERFRTEVCRHVYDCAEEGLELVTDGPEWNTVENSFCRASSKCHQGYTQAMGVRSTFTLGVNVGGGLVALVIGHNSSPKLVTFARRVTCEALLDGLCARLSLAPDEDLPGNPALEALVQPIAPLATVLEALRHTHVCELPIVMHLSLDTVSEGCRRGMPGSPEGGSIASAVTRVSLACTGFSKTSCGSIGPWSRPCL
jgi:hypothetical protein